MLKVEFGSRKNGTRAGELLSGEAFLWEGNPSDSDVVFIRVDTTCGYFMGQPPEVRNRVYALNTKGFGIATISNDDQVVRLDAVLKANLP